MEFSTVKLTHILTLLLTLCKVVNGETDPNDFKILNDFRTGLQNPELLKWPGTGSDPCGPPSWSHVFCSNGRVTQIQVQSLGLKGTLPQNLNQLDKLCNVGLQKNEFTGNLPSFSGLSSLEFAYLDENRFDSIPVDFFNGLNSVRVLALDDNPFNQTLGWSLPAELAECEQLVNFSCSRCNLIGPVPDFFGKFSSLGSLRLSGNKLIGEIPNSFRDSMLRVLQLNDQGGGGISGSIEVIGTMVGLTQVWLQGNQFTGPIPDSIGGLASLRELNMNRNQLVGLIPQTLADMNLDLLDLSNNMFMGAIPKFKSKHVSYESNPFCQSDPVFKCAPEVNSLLDFLRDLNYPKKLASDWSGNDPCTGHWLGVACNTKDEVSILHLQKLGLEGTVSPSLGNLPSLLEIRLDGNNLHGVVPSNLTLSRSLRLLNISGNDFDPPLPRFGNGVKVVSEGNSKLLGKLPKRPSSPAAAPPLPPPVHNPPAGGDPQPPLPDAPPENGKGSRPAPHEKGSQPDSLTTETGRPAPKSSTNSRVVIIAAAAGGTAIFTLLAILFAIWKKRNTTKNSPVGVVIHPADSSNPSNSAKITVADTLSLTGRPGSGTSIDGSGHSHTGVFESGNMVISFQVLRRVTQNFAKENELGRGGFGVVYKGELHDGTKLAVKRMECLAISNKALDEFQVEIAVLSKVRHRHLVSLLGYSIEGNERLLVYEYMPQGALSRHLFRWRNLNLEPLCWAKRISIALDVARGVEYLHNLTHQSFIHRDLKSANILLDDDFRAKVSDFGLVKLAPDKEVSVATRLAGTFGYLAPEYAVTGKITTKVDIFSFGVVLIELLTGLIALDEQRPEEKRYLVEWFWTIKSNQETLIASIDPSIEAKEDIYESIYILADLAGHCTAREANHRPDMGHAVNVLSQLVDKWKPYEEKDEYGGIDVTLPLPQMLKGWQEADNKDFSGNSEDSKGSIPAKPSGFADSFTSADAR